MIDVPADGLCFYHCLGALLRRETESFPTREAQRIRVDIGRKLLEMGWEDEAERMQLRGTAGYPDELAFVAAAQLIPGNCEYSRLISNCARMEKVLVFCRLSKR